MPGGYAKKLFPLIGAGVLAVAARDRQRAKYVELHRFYARAGKDIAWSAA